VTNMQTSTVPAGITCGSPHDTAQGPTIDCTAPTNTKLAIRFTSLNGDVMPANVQVTSKPAAFTCSGPVAIATGYTITCTTIRTRTAPRTALAR